MAVIVADARRLPLRDGCVNAVVTSPPYWGLRDYGSADQIGLERTPEAYVCSLRAVFAELWRVLKDDGTVFLNLGDSYANDGKWGGETGGKQSYLPDNDRQRVGRSKRLTGLKPKDLVGIPWRVAFALQADGWYLRSDIIWHKPNPMPENVTDRPTKAHEYLFLLAKRARYFYDAAVIRETAEKTGTIAHLAGGGGKRAGTREGLRRPEWIERKRVQAASQPPADCGVSLDPLFSRNARSVWTIPTQPYPDAHFATMPEALVEPCILAGCPVGGLVCDPFLGSGTVGAVAERLGRRWVGTDLSYQPLASARTAQRGLRW